MAILAIPDLTNDIMERMNDFIDKGDVNRKVFAVLSVDTTDEEGTEFSIISVHRRKDDAQRVLGAKRKEILDMYHAKIPNPDGNVKIDVDTPDCFHIFDEYSNNDTKVSIEEREIK